MTQTTAIETNARPDGAPGPAAAPAPRTPWLQRLLATRRGYLAAYAVLFLLAWVPVAAVLLSHGKSLFWNFDGLSQQYVWFVYTGQWLREVFSNIFVEHTFEIPLWDMTMGFGSDMLQTVLCTVINPFYAVSALVPEEHAEFAFETSMMAQIFLAGLTFSLWCAGRGVERPFVLVGAITYVFAGNMVEVFYQPGFLFAPLVFPLLLYTVDRVFAGKSPLPYIALLAWSLAFSFYDSYMMLILTVLYCLVVFFGAVDRGAPRAGRVRRLLGWVGRFTVYTLLAIMVACVLFLPQAMSLMGMDRLDSDRTTPLLYAPVYYVNYIMGLSTYSFTGGDAYMGLGVLIVPTLAVLVLNARRNRPLLVAFLVLTVIMLLPVCGRIMNGMAYASNRWSWGYSVCGAYLVARFIPQLLELDKKKTRVLLAVVCVYAAACVVLPISLRAKVACAAMLAALFAVLLWRSRFPGRAVASLAVCAAFGGTVSMCAVLEGQLHHLVDIDDSWPAHTQRGVAALVDEARSEGVYDELSRVDRASTLNTIHNSCMVAGYMGPDFYNSIYNDGIDDLWNTLGMTDTWGINIGYGGLNSRGTLDALLGVRYFCIPAGATSLLPYTFADGRVVADGDGAGPEAMFETDHVASLATVRGVYMTESDYRSLPMEDRQMALLDAVVLADGAETGGLERVRPADIAGAVEIPFEVVAAQGCRLEDGALVVEEPGATLQIAYEGAADREQYLVFENLDYVDDYYQQIVAQTRAGSLLERLKGLARRATVWEQEAGYLHVNDARGVPTAAVSVITDRGAMYGGKHDWMCNLGAVDDGPHTATIVFDSTGVFTFDAMFVAAQPLAGAVEKVDALAASTARDIRIGTNELSCAVEADGDALVFFSVAYSKGWSAEVDGEPAEVLKADLGFMAVPVGAGEHEMRLTYRTPYLAAGALVTVAGVAGTALLLAVRRRRISRAGDLAVPGKHE